MEAPNSPRAGGIPTHQGTSTRTGSLRQLYILLRKNFRLQFRRRTATVFELLLPLFFFIVLVLVRTRVESEDKPAFIPGYSDLSAAAAANVDNCIVNLLPKNYRYIESTGETPEACFPLGGENPRFLAYSPDTPAIKTVMDNFQSTLPIPVRGYPSESALLIAAKNDTHLFAGVVFETNSTGDLGYNVEYALRMRPSDTPETDWHTNEQFPKIQQMGPRKGRKNEFYYYSGFVFVQHHINTAIITALNAAEGGSTNLVLPDPSTVLKQFPYPAYLMDRFAMSIAYSLPLMILLSFLYTAMNIVREIVYEKEMRLRESQKMMGLKNWVNWSAWFVKSFVFMFISIVVMTIIAKAGGVVKNTSGGVLLVYLICYAVATISLCCLISTFFSKSKIAAAAGGIIFFLTYFPYFFIQPRYSDVGSTVKAGSCILSTTCMSLGAQIISMYESRGDGITWSTFSSGPDVSDPFSLGNVCALLLFDALFYAVLTWYIEGVFPGQYGMPRRWYFPFQLSYWCGSSSKAAYYEPVASDEMPPADSDNAAYEAEPVGMVAGVRIQGLRKVFDRKVAVNSLYLNMYESQVTALLGHNGAGKTTTTSMLSGLFPPTAGTALIGGLDIKTDMDAIRTNLGICPQHNILYDSLTVREHLDFYARLKGVPGGQVNAEVASMLADVGLLDKADEPSRSLSGGMKRRLSVGIALIGGSQVVFLDEPTSGMDPYARRKTWDLIMKHKQGRTILLTTHFLDEADLCDRIAIMGDGKLRCVGTSLFLKSHYGIGYHLSFVKETLEACREGTMSAFVQEFVPDAELVSNVSGEIAYALPSHASGRFEELFSSLEREQKRLGFKSYGVSMTTLEEVFLKVGENMDQSLAERKASTASSSARNGEDGKGADNMVSPATTAPNGTTQDYFGKEKSRMANQSDEATANDSLLVDMSRSGSGGILSEEKLIAPGAELKKRQFGALLVKRFTHSKRDKKAVVTQLILPVIFTVLAMIVAKTMPNAKQSPSLLLTPESAFGDADILAPYTTDMNIGSSMDLLRSKVLDTYKKYDPSGTLQNWGDGNMTEAIMRTQLANPTLRQHRMGGFSFSNSSAAGETGIPATAWYNNNAYHAIAIFLSVMDSAALSASVAEGNSASIKTFNHPLPKTTEETFNDFKADPTSFSLSFDVLFGLSFCVASFTLFLVQERASNAKHLQFVSGVDSVTYWVATLVWDLINFTVPAIIITIVFAIFRVDAYQGSNLGGVLLLLLLFGWAATPVAYFFTFVFKVPMTAFAMATVFNVMLGLGTLLTSFLLDIPSLGLVDVNDYLKKAFLILPNFCLGEGLMNIYENYEYGKLCSQSEFAKLACQELGYEEVPMFQLSGNGIGLQVLCLLAEGVVYFLLVLLIEKRFFVKSKRQQWSPSLGAVGADDEDDDVRMERERVQMANGDTGETICIDGLAKVYPLKGSKKKQKVAVNGVSLGIPSRQCFGLLGINGAGKSSTFKMLTGELKPTAGDAMMAGHSMLNEMDLVRQKIGYCPQFDALIDLMTGRELLIMYARLRGVSERSVKRVAAELISLLSLDKHADKPCGTYSGGNKRKLSVAIALVGAPPILFLDEPTSGMDVGAKRFLWQVISRVVEEGRCVVLTSHSMEECEALCQRLVIMVNGSYKCIGSTQHLKSKFGEGYSVVVKVEPDSDTSPLKGLIDTTFRGAVLKEEAYGVLNYQLPRGDITWSSIFGSLERAREKFGILDYSVSQTSLDTIFVGFAKQQRDEYEQDGE